MKGTRPLSIEEIALVSESFEGRYCIRNKNLFMLGVSSGGRISELLSLRISDVYQNGNPVSHLVFSKSVVKGKENSRAVFLNSDGIAAIDELICWHREAYGRVYKRRCLFPSRKRNSRGVLLPITRQHADRVFKAACEKAALNGKLATHSLRKSYAQRLYNEVADIFCIKEMLGHQRVADTLSYISVDYSKVQEASEAMSLQSHLKKRS